ncbi:MAG: hypothetical protein V3V20_10295, partial [Algisphaera sp.]
MSASASVDVQADYLWWEGETPTVTTVKSGSAFGVDTAAQGDHFSVLSGDDWISGTVKAGQPGVSASYELNIPKAGTYAFWVRKFWLHGPFQWRFGDQPWQNLGRDLSLANRASIRKHLNADWVSLGPVELDAGPTTFTWELNDLQPDKDEAFAFDCFLLTQTPFTPRGEMKPDARNTDAMPGYFAWDPPADMFPEDAGFDHRHLNEDFAGIHGRLQKTQDGNGFLLGDGSPVRFWGVNINPNLAGVPDAMLNQYARRLAKNGVNLVRLHTSFWDKKFGQWNVDPEKLDRLHRIVAALKKQGVYSEVSFYFPLTVNAYAAGVPGYHPEDDASPDPTPYTAHMFDPDTQAFYFKTMRDIFTPVNPHTGLSLAQDPAVAMVELVNEDSFFFWTFGKGRMSPARWERLEDMYKKSPHYVGGELQGSWSMTRKGYEESWHKDQIQAQVAFLADTQRAFYEKAIAELNGLGYDGLTVCSNWHTTEPALLDAIERWTYTAGDVIDHHGYFEGEQEGEGASYSVRVGHTFKSKSALENLSGLPLRINQVQGHPQLLSEVNWPLPNEHRADMVWLTFAALATQGVDAVCFFQDTSLTGIETDFSNKFTLNLPSMTGQFPAAALAFRRGDLPEQEPVFLESLSMKNLTAMKGSATANSASFDRLRVVDVPEDQRNVQDLQSLDPLAYYLGPVVRVYNQSGVESQKGKQFGELAILDSLNKDKPRNIWTHFFEPGDAPDAYGLSINEPYVAAWAGNTTDTTPRALGPFTTIPLASHGAVSAVSLDNLPLDQSRRILLTRVTTERPFGFHVENNVIKSLGDLPLNLPLTGHHPIAWDTTDGRRYQATALDENGNRKSPVLPLEQNDQAGEL